MSESPLEKHNEYPTGMNTNVEYLKQNKDYIVNKYIHYAFKYYINDFEINSEYTDEFAEHIFQCIIKLFESKIWDCVAYTLFRLSNTVVDDWNYIDELCVFIENDLFNYEKVSNIYLIEKHNSKPTTEYTKLRKRELIDSIFKKILDRICIQEFMINIT